MEPKEMTTPEQVLDALGDHIINVMNDREMRGCYALCRLLDRYIELLREMPESSTLILAPRRKDNEA